MRFFAPAYRQVEPQRFAHPAFAALAPWRDLLTGADWPTLATLNARFGAPRHRYAGCRLRFVEQTPALLADGLHYEARICHGGEIATRAANWHDLLNALIWIVYTPLKAALNKRQAEEVQRHGPKQRSRAQSALTHFDETGLVVVVDTPQRVAAWDRHDWHTLLFAERAAWRDGRIRVHVFGHALLEHLLWPVLSVIGKALVVVAREPDLDALADVLAAGSLLGDPQALRPLPAAGIPGWCPGQDSAFYASQACFRPLPPGRRYPAPYAIS